MDQGHDDTGRAARRFVAAWEAGWAGHDVDALLTLYAEDCVHRSMPFRAPHRGRAALGEYLRWSFVDERPVDVRFGEPVVGPGGVAVAEFRVLAEEDGRPTTLAGCVFVRFDDAGLAVETRDYWHTADGHREPEGGLFLTPRAG
ncbi:nuclear transport factor 2 family protein [Streptomyces longispororuber]|uniref:nuclear transport factor 2 family protein n=1 Tax=Streptomyces longispororuber TaxID=68230 RepID=UPI00210B275F|nr:nuclear transport factor 2 family protein [Streptomyces longispororuber]MCQ4206086.1 nuclear transport factor 2 family protein [Streptomyces longispororuber]